MSPARPDLTARPLTPLMRDILRALRNGEAMTPNVIGSLCGVEPRPGGQYRSRGPGSIIAGALTNLQRRGLIHHAARPDGLSGTAYVITDAGREAVAPKPSEQTVPSSETINRRHREGQL